MGSQCRNDTQLQAFLMPKVEIIVKNILEKVKDENKEQIDAIVYKKSTGFYERTYEFREAWGYDDTNRLGSHVSGKFKYEPEKMTYNPELGQHGTPQEYVDRGVTMSPSRDYLADIIYEGVEKGLFLGDWSESRDAWGELMKVVGSAKMKEWLYDAASAAGLNIRYHHKPILREDK